MSETCQLCTFLVGDLYLAIPVHHVQEVIRSLDMTVVPLSPVMVRGLINLRGQIVTAIDLRTRLGLASSTMSTDSVHIVIRTEDGAVSLLVDAIDDVLEVPRSARERVPEHIDAEARELFECVYKLDTRLLLLLDIKRALVMEHAALA